MTYLRGLSGWRALLAAALLGVLAAAALPPFTILPVLLISIPGLLALIDGARGPGRAALRGIAFGTAHHLAGLYWVTDAVLVEAKEFWWAVPVAVPLLAFALSLFIAAPCSLARLVPAGWRRATVLAGAWVLGDIARQFALTGFPWNPLGSAIELPGWLGLVFMQPAAWVGVGGLTLAVLVMASAPYCGLYGRAGAVGMLALWLICGTARLNREPAPGPAIMAVIVQGNVSEIEHRDHWRERPWNAAIFNRHLTLTRQGMAQVAGKRALVIWPETASPYWVQQDQGAASAIAEASAPAIASLIGTAREGDPGHAYNSMVVVTPDGRTDGFYDKHHLVPYGEYFPSYLPIRLGERGWDAGPGLKTLHAPGLPPIGPLICFEAAFPAQVVVEHDRPSMIVNLTNDSWFGESAGPRQHLAAARMRAVEEGLPILRAANTGISAIIDAHGRVRERLGLDRQGVLIGPVPGDLPPTPVSRMGLGAPLLLALTACATAAGVGRRRGKAGFPADIVQKTKEGDEKLKLH